MPPHTRKIGVRRRQHHMSAAIPALGKDIFDDLPRPSWLLDLGLRRREDVGEGSGFDARSAGARRKPRGNKMFGQQRSPVDGKGDSEICVCVVVWDVGVLGFTL